MDIPAIIPLSELAQYPLAQIGFLGEKLASWHQQHIPLASAGLVPVAVLEKIADSNKLSAQITTACQNLDWTSEKKLGRALNKIKKLIINQQFPEPLSEPILDFYQQSIDPHFAKVQASRVEDQQLPRQAKGVENIQGEANLIESLLSVWAAQVKFDLENRTLELFPAALIIQAQSQPTASGIAYSHHPQASKKTIVVESVWGVFNYQDKKLEPDLLTIDIRTHQVISRQPGLKIAIWKRSSDRLKKTRPPHYKKTALSLSDGQASLLAKITHRLRQFQFGPIKVYWSLFEDQITIDQVLNLGEKKATGQPSHILQGQTLHPGLISASCRVIVDPSQSDQVGTGEIIIVDQLLPQHLPLLNKVAGIICDLGLSSPSLVSHLADHSLPTLLKTQFATTKLRDGQTITLDADQGRVWIENQAPGLISASHQLTNQFNQTQPTITKLYISAGNPYKAREYLADEVDGVGVLRSEYTFASFGDHPMHVIRSRKRNSLKEKLIKAILTYQQGKARLPVIYRSQNFTSDEMQHLAHATTYAEQETNPYLGFRGGLKMLKQSELFNFELEVIQEALAKSSAPVGLMLPFVRSPSELKLIHNLIEKAKLTNQPNFELWLQLNTPENVLQVQHYLHPNLAGFSLNVRSLHALLHGIDPDSPDIYSFYPLDVNLVKQLLAMLMGKLKGKSPFSSTKLQDKYQLFLHLEDHNTQLIEIATELGLDGITVKPNFVKTAKNIIIETEQKRF